MKKRSSFWRLNRVVKCMDALVLAVSMMPYLAFCRWAANPAGKPSRRKRGRLNEAGDAA